jgi:hypothetical protein
MDQWVAHHWQLCVAGWWLFNVLVSTMPPPAPNAHQGYVWLHNALQSIAGNGKQVFQNLPDGIQNAFSQKK